MSYLLDTGFLYGLLNENDRKHRTIQAIAVNITEQILLPTVVTTEVAFLVRRNLGNKALEEFLLILASDQFLLTESTPTDYKRASEIVRKYADSKIDFVDAVIFAMSERLQIIKILTLDQRDFRMFRPKHCPAFELYP